MFADLCIFGCRQYFKAMPKNKTKFTEKGEQSMKNVPNSRADIVERKKEYAKPILTVVCVDSDFHTNSPISNGPNETPAIFY